MPAPNAEVQVPNAPPELLRADEHAFKEAGDSEWTLLASKDANWLEFHGRIRECHVRVSALCPVNQLDALDKGVGRGGEFEELGRPGHFNNLFNHQFGDAVVEPLAFLGFVWEERPLELNLGFPAQLDLKGRRVSPDQDAWVDERLNRTAIEARYRQGERAVSTIRARTADLERFIAERESALVIYDFHQILLRDFTAAELAGFERADGFTSGSLSQGMRRFIQNWAPSGNRGFEADSYLQRRVHSWRVIRPEQTGGSEWRRRHERVDFDVARFTFPTRLGEVAPARFVHLELPRESIAGVRCDFMDRVFFDQRVLERFEKDENYEVSDGGEIHCKHYWGLTRSTARIGNKWLTTGIGDFAEGVPMEEWIYFRQFSVPVPSRADVDIARQEPELPKLVNEVRSALESLNEFATWLAEDFSELEGTVWHHKMDSAEPVLKAYMADFVDKAAFAHRITVLSGLVVDGLDKSALQGLLSAVAGTQAPKEFKQHGTRRWLEHLATVALVAKDMGTLDLETLARPLQLALEWTAPIGGEEETAAEMKLLRQRAREQLAPIAFLYDLRTGGGIAHPDSEKWEAGMQGLGLNGNALSRAAYISVLEQVRDALAGVHAAARRALLCCRA